MIKQNRKKGFSLIELIVIMGIMAILVLIAVPKFLGNTKEARLIKIKASAKEIESASDRYYLKNNDWPRATSEDDYYSKDELESYAKEIYDKTGAIINLEETGHYYEIDYIALKNYVRVPDDSVKYIIQNPVGRVYYLDKLTPEGEQIFNKGKDDTQIVTPTPIPEPELEPSDEGWFIIDVNGAVSASDTLKSLPGPIDLVIPSVIKGKTAVKIANSGFKNLKNINYVKLPDTVTYIDAYAFNDSTLSKIDLSKNLTEISTSAFANLSNLTEITVTENVKKIGNYCFSNSVKLTSVGLPEGLTYIGRNAFDGLINVSSIDIPSTVETIGLDAFTKWTINQSIIIKPRNNKNISISVGIGGSAKVIFEDTDDYFVISKGSITRNNLLVNVKKVNTLTIPSEIKGQKITKIDASAFNVLTNFPIIEIPETVINIGHYAFSSLTSSQTIKFLNRSNLSGVTVGSLWYGAANVIYVP